MNGGRPFVPRVTGNGLRIATMGTLQTPTTLPTGNDGTNPRYVRVAVEPQVGTAGIVPFVYVRFNSNGMTAVTCTNTDVMVSSYEAMTFETRGMAFVSVLTGSQTAFVNVMPLENG